MNFGLSPSDIIKLVEMSNRVHDAFNNANISSASQVEALVREFSDFHHCLVILDDLMKDYDKPLPFPCSGFKETLERCKKTLEPYEDHLVDKRMNAKKIFYTIRYIGKENEVDWLRKRIGGHYQILHLCISFLQLRLQLEATKETQRLLATAPFRTMSLAGHMYSSNAFASSSGVTPHALPAASEADELYRDWTMIIDMLKTEEERLAVEANKPRPLSFGDAPAMFGNGDAERAAVLYQVRQEAEATLTLGENRAKRTAVEKRTNLSPSDAIRQEVRNMPPVPRRTYTLETDHSGDFSRFNHQSMADSMATVRPPSITYSPLTSSAGSPKLERIEFTSVDWGSISPDLHASDLSRTHSTSTERTDASVPGLGILTAETIPEHQGQLRRRTSIASLATIALGEGALDWQKLSHKVLVERSTPDGIKEQECDIHWRYREDTGMSLRSVYRSASKKTSVWVTQNFSAAGPSIPLTTSIGASVVVDFPKSSFGRLDKKCTDIKYIFPNPEASFPLQKLLYTNNGMDDAELLYDRSVHTINSNITKPECRGKNLRLWRRRELHNGPQGLESVHVLTLLFYTSSLGDKGHWVEEPHYMFEWLEESVHKKPSDKLKLVFSKEPERYWRDKVYRHQRGLSATGGQEIVNDETARALRGSPSGSAQTIRRSGTVSSVTSSTRSVKSVAPSLFGASRPKGVTGNLNRFGYSELEIKFQNMQDQQDFLEIWRKHFRRFGAFDTP